MRHWADGMGWGKGASLVRPGSGVMRGVCGGARCVPGGAACLRGGPRLLQRHSHVRRRRIEHRCDLTHVCVSLLEKIALEYMRQGARVGARARARCGLRVAPGFGCGPDTRISSAKLLSSPSRALTASKSNTNCARQQAQRDGDRCSSHGSSRRELPRTPAGAWPLLSRPVPSAW